MSIDLIKKIFTIRSICLRPTDDKMEVMGILLYALLNLLFISKQRGVVIFTIRSLS